MPKQIRQLKSKDVPKLRKWILKNKQKGKCAICGCIPERPCLDHDHKKKIKGTGKIRGVLCNKCNVFIAKSENNCIRYGIAQKDLPTTLRACANYLEQPQYPYMHPSEKPKDPKLTKRSYNKLKKALGDIGIKCPAMSKSGKLTQPLQQAFDRCGIDPEFYKK